MTSTDGVKWQKRFLGREIFRTVQWGPAGWVAMADYCAYTSTDGQSWQKHTQGLDSLISPSLDANDTLLVVVGRSGKIATSRDGMSWISRPSGTRKDFQQVAWSGRFWLAMGADVRATSTDGVNWQSEDFAMARSHSGLAWLDSAFYAGDPLGSGVIRFSADGVGWPQVKVDGLSVMAGFAQGPGGFVAVGDGGSIAFSPDGGRSWTQQKVSPRMLQDLRGVVWADSQWVTVGTGGAILTSPDGKNWTRRSEGDGRELRSVVWAGSRFVAVGIIGSIATSPDGFAWSWQTQADSLPMYGVGWNGREVVAVGMLGSLRVSQDGATWETRTPPTRARLNALAWNGKTWVAAGDSGTLLTSSDAVTWVKRASPVAFPLTGVAWAGERFIAVGTGKQFAISSTGETWDTVGAPAGSWNAVAWSGRQILAVGSFGALAASTDGMLWQSVSPGSLSPEMGILSWRHAHWTGSEWLLAADWGDMWLSRDGRQWSRWFTDQTQSLFATASNGETLVVVGEDGMIMTASAGALGIMPKRIRKVNPRGRTLPVFEWKSAPPNTVYRVDGVRIPGGETLKPDLR